MNQTDTPAKVASNDQLGGSTEHWPNTAEEVRHFVGRDFCTLIHARPDGIPDDGDRYTMTAHDIISAIRSWRDYVLGHEA